MHNIESELKSCGSIDVCHDVSLDIDDVTIEQSIFIVEHFVSDLLLRRSWEKAPRAEFVNEDDGSYTMKIKNPEDRRIVQFCAVSAEHKRNLEFTRFTKKDTVRSNRLKV